MRIQNFEIGDRVTITKSELSGRVIQTGGKYAKVETNTGVVRIQISRLRHMDTWGAIALKRVTKQVTKFLKKF